MGKLTVRQIETAKPKAKPYKLMDGDGLQLRVAVDGSKTWIVRYFIDGSERQYTLPRIYGDTSDTGHCSLADARTEAAAIRALARQGIDYRLKLEDDRRADAARREREKAEALTVQDLYTAWIKTVKRKDGGAELRRSFTRDVLPFIGSRPLKALIEQDVTEAIAGVLERGANRTAVVVLNNLKQMFRWGKGRRPWKTLIDDPTASLSPDDVITGGYKATERERALSPAEVTELAEKLPQAGLLKRTELAMWIITACCTRIGETVMAEKEHVNLLAGEWFIPGENTKNGNDHTIYLSAFAISLFKELFQLSDESKWCFPGAGGDTHVCPKSTTKQIRDRQRAAKQRGAMSKRAAGTDALLLAGGGWTPHDLRRTGATMMQSLGVTPEVIERVLNHTEQNKLKRTYQTYDYAKEKREAWRLLGDRLALLTNPSANVITLQRSA